MYSLLLLFSLAGLDGEGDNRADLVRPIPPAGIAVPDADRAGLEAGLKELGEAIDGLRGRPSPISSRTLQRKITRCRSFPGSSRRIAMTCAAEPTRSSKDRAVARSPARRTYSFGLVTVKRCSIPSAST